MDERTRAADRNRDDDLRQAMIDATKDGVREGVVEYLTTNPQVVSEAVKQAASEMLFRHSSEIVSAVYRATRDRG